MRVTEARALCADLHECPWDDVVIAAAITQTSAALVGASPQVTPVEGAPGLWWVGASGFDSLGGERTLARQLLDVAKRWHPRPRVAVAGSCVAARAATWAGASFQANASDRSLVHVIPSGHDAAYLAPAPLALVPMDEELREALTALGLRTVGAFAMLEAEDVERRWGEIGLRAWRLARADDPRRPVLARAETQPAVEVELATPAATMEPVLFLVRAALDRLLGEMIAHGRAVAAIAITLTLDDERGPMGNGPPHTVTREARTARPLARLVPLFERCRALLDTWTLTAPVIAVRVAIAAAAPLSGEQGDLLSTSWRDIAAADAAFERLRAELGAGAVVRAEARDTHRPEAKARWTDIQEDRRTGRQDDRTGTTGSEAMTLRPILSSPSCRPVLLSSCHPSAHRAFNPPEDIHVACDVHAAPLSILWRGHRIAVTRALGPERLSGDWWDDGYRRDYWRCESTAGEMTVFLDRSDDAWRMQTLND